MLLKNKTDSMEELFKHQVVFRIFFFFFGFHILLLWLAYGKPNWEIIMLEYFNGMLS